MSASAVTDLIIPCHTNSVLVFYSRCRYTAVTCITLSPVYHLITIIVLQSPYHHRLNIVILSRSHHHHCITMLLRYHPITLVSAIKYHHWNTLTPLNNPITTSSPYHSIPTESPYHLWIIQSSLYHPTTTKSPYHHQGRSQDFLQEGAKLTGAQSKPPQNPKSHRISSPIFWRGPK